MRTLHHYDAIGLLRAGERTGAGHRRYTEADLRRLYRVRALRALGASLDEIRTALADPVDDLASMRALLSAQLDALEAQADRIGGLARRVDGLLRRLDSEMPDPDQFMATLEMISMLDGHFTTEQQERLAERRDELGPEAVEEAKARWVALVEELLPHVQAGTPVDDPRVRDLVRRWDELGGAFHTGHADGEETKAAARRMWQGRQDELSRRLPWSAGRLAGLVGYLERVRQSR